MSSQAAASTLSKRTGVPLAAMTALAAAGIALAAVVLPAREDPGAADGARLELAASGDLRLGNSKEGSWVVRTGHLAPGQSRQGRVAISVSGSEAQLRLRPEDLTGGAGPNGAPLAEVLRVRVYRPWAWRAANRRPVYSGSLAAMSTTTLGRVDPGSVRRYRIRVTLPDGGAPPSPVAGDNLYQGSAAEVSFVWEAAGGT